MTVPSTLASEDIFSATCRSVRKTGGYAIIAIELQDTKDNGTSLQNSEFLQL